MKIMKMNKLNFLRSKFYYDDNGLPKLSCYGQFLQGLTNKEITEYLQVRANNLNIDSIYKKFNKIAGCNTVGMFVCPNCKKETILMYRHDVERIADVLFGKTKGTYFD